MSSFEFDEAALLSPLVKALRQRRLIRQDSLLVQEFPWLGRFVDLAVLTRSGVTLAFELKLSKTKNVLNQAALNGVTFDRSYVVVATRPTEMNLARASDLGIGVLLVDPLRVTAQRLIAAQKNEVHPVARRKLKRSLASRGLERDNV